MARYKFPLGATMMMVSPTTSRVPTKTVDPALLRQVIRRTGGMTFRLRTPTPTMAPKTAPAPTTVDPALLRQVIRRTRDMTFHLHKAVPSMAPKSGLVATPEPPAPTPPAPTPEPVPSPLPPDSTTPIEALTASDVPVPSYKGISVPYEGGVDSGEPIDILPSIELPSLPDVAEVTKAAKSISTNTLLIGGAAILIAYVVLK